MYYLYKQGIIPPSPNIPEGIEIRRQKPHPFVHKMSAMQIGKKKYYYYRFMTFLCRGFRRVFKEYDVLINNEIVSKAVLISKVPTYGFLPDKGIHVCYCETIPEVRGRGYYPLLLRYIQNDMPENNLYMIVDVNNDASIKGIEKAGFVRYGEGQKLANGKIVENK